MASSLFCCGEYQPYRPQHLDHEARFTAFMKWAAFPKESSVEDVTTSVNDISRSSFAIQLVKQINFGALEWKKYFVPDEGKAGEFVQVSEDDLIRANFQKVNTYKNYRCGSHNKFFEVNVYQHDPINRHHWRATLARPARDIDLNTSGSHSEVRRSEISHKANPTTNPSEGIGLAPALAATVADVSRTADFDSDVYISHTSRGYGYGFSGGRGDDDSSSPDKDLTACDKECGYCGHCDY